MLYRSHRRPARPPLPRAARSQGRFTLIELLVVVAIIAVLAAMLLPSLNNARSRAKRIVCMGNQKQITLATSLYTEENEGYYPHYANQLPMLKDYAGGLMGPGTTFFCPAAEGRPIVSWDGDSDRDLGGPYYANGQNTYGFNAHLSGTSNWHANAWPYWWVAGPRIKESDLSEPSRVMAVTDTTSSRFDIYYSPGFMPAFRHGGSGPGLVTTAGKRAGVGFNIGYVDGHAAWTTWSDWLDFRLTGNASHKTGQGKYAYSWR